MQGPHEYFAVLTKNSGIKTSALKLLLLCYFLYILSFCKSLIITEMLEVILFSCILNTGKIKDTYSFVDEKAFLQSA